MLFLGQSLGSAGFLAASTVNALVGAALSGRPSWAGVPGATYHFGMALAASVWGYAMDRLGRRATLSLGVLAGVLGAGLACHAVAVGSLGLFLFGLLLMGGANSALQLGRFVAAEVHPPAERGRAVANVVLGGTVGAILGPLLVGPAGRWASAVEAPELAGPYGASAALFAVAGLLLVALLRPEPFHLAREVAALYPGPVRSSGSARPLRDILQDRITIVAIVSLVSAQAVMVMLMVITSLHMSHHDHPLASISVVISSHVLGMYAFSALSGRLADRWGRGRVIAAGAGALAVACAAAPLFPRVLPLSAALFLLGMGWNFCYVGGSALLSDRLQPEERARTQGLNDTLMGTASATGSLLSGVVFATVGYAAMGALAAVAALLPLLLAQWTLPPFRRAGGAG